jgi:hypothetical protein
MVPIFWRQCRYFGSVDGASVATLSKTIFDAHPEEAWFVTAV